MPADNKGVCVIAVTSFAKHSVELNRLACEVQPVYITFFRRLNMDGALLWAA